MKWAPGYLVDRAQFFYTLARRGEAIHQILSSTYRDPLLAAEKAADPKTITPYGFTAFSQADEDGILEEIFRRIGTTNRQFFEFGCGDGVENNSTYLIFTGWKGLWMDGNPDFANTIGKGFKSYIDSGALRMKSAFITCENINDLIREAAIPEEVDMMSIDIDGNDYWVWQKLESVAPMIVIVEYNSIFGPDLAVTIPYDPKFVRHQAHYSGQFWGASLQALAFLAGRKEYSLVGCNSAGNNAYFVRNNKIGELNVLSPQQAFVDARFRDSRDEKGNLNQLTGAERFRAIAALSVYDVRQNKIAPLQALQGAPIPS